jgi:hypothetical protein
MELLSVASRLALEAVGEQKASYMKAFLDGKNRQKKSLAQSIA